MQENILNDIFRHFLFHHSCDIRHNTGIVMTKQAVESLTIPFS